MDFTIHRGQHEIGGMCIEVSADDGTRILLDLGMPLVAPDGGEFPFCTPQRSTQELIAEGVLRDIPGLYEHQPDAPGIKGIVLSHAHLDHWGLAHHAHPDIPVFGSVGTVAIIEVGRVFFPDSQLPSSLHVLPEDDPVTFGPLSVTAIPVDHAAPDSRALLVEGDGQRLLYTGDLRAHGRTGHLFERMLIDERLREVDWLLVEGTTLGSSGDSHGLKTESGVEDELVGLAGLYPDKIMAVVASGQNIDRLVSCYRAARRCRRQLVVDPYQAFVLSRLADLSPAIPQFDWADVRVSFSPHQVGRLKEAELMPLVNDMARHGRVSSDELAQHPGRFLFCCRGSLGMTKVFAKVGHDHVVLVWSLWSGYWDRDKSPMRKWAERVSVPPRFVHSGGHAWPEDLERLLDALRPGETVWVHTDKDRPVR